MTTRYVIAADGIWTGETVEWQETQAIPERTVTAQPPVLYPGEYALWVGAWAVVNERPQPPEEPDPVPHYPDLTRRQLNRVLRLIGITGDMVEAQIIDLAAQQIAAAQDIEDELERQLTIDAIELERDLALIDWQDASQYERDHPLLNDVAAAFDLPAEEVDALWLWAAEL